MEITGNDAAAAGLAVRSRRSPANARSTSRAPLQEEATASELSGAA
jgi:hypothetical protein